MQIFKWNKTPRDKETKKQIDHKEKLKIEMKAS